MSKTSRARARSVKSVEIRFIDGERAAHSPEFYEEKLAKQAISNPNQFRVPAI